MLVFEALSTFPSLAVEINGSDMMQVFTLEKIVK